MPYSQADIQGKLLGAPGFWASVQFAWKRYKDGGKQNMT